MKYFNLKHVVLLAIILVFTQCSKTNNDEAPTDMRITVIDQTGNRVAGATVKFAQSPYFMPGYTSTQTSDINGNVLFSNISTSSRFYYIYAEVGCNNNVADTSFPRFLTLNTLNVDSIIVYEKGALRINNTSNEGYHISSSFFNTTLPANIQTTYNPRAGNYVVHSEQLSSPGAGKDTLIHITCGDTSTITLPY
jgi:hypothetical protein